MQITMVFCFLARTENLTSGKKLQRNVCGMGIIMNGEERREKLVELLKNTESPLSGTRLSRLLHVSRQAIVNDIALLRAANVDILSTNRGYLLSVPVSSTRIFKVCHATEDFEREMQAIIDAGGKIQDIIIEHPVYGRISAPLEIYSRNDIVKFKEKMQSGNAVPLCDITSGVHYHTILAYSDEILDDVAAALKSNGFLLS